MQIELQVRSPEMKLTGFDQALAKLDSLEQSLIRLAEFKKFDFKITVSAPGLGKLKGDLAGLEANTRNLAAMLREAGQVKLGGLVESGMVSAGEALKATTQEADRLGRKFTEIGAQREVVMRQFGSLKGQSNLSTNEVLRMEELNGWLDKNASILGVVETRMRAIHEARGMATAMSGAGGTAPEAGATKGAGAAVSEQAEAEARLAAAQGPAIAGMKLQEEIARLKAAKMAALKKEVEGTASAEGNLDTSTKGSTASMTAATRQAGMLSQTYRRVKDGEEELVKTRERNAAGDVVTTDPKKGWVTREVTELDKLKRAMAEAERSGQATFLASPGDDAARVKSLRDQAAEMRKLAASTDLQSEAWVQQKVKAADALDIQARSIEQGMKSAEQRKDEIRQLDNYKQAAHQIRTDAKDAQGLGIGGKADGMRAEAQALDQLRMSMGLGTKEADTFSRQMETQAATLRMHANEMDRISTERATMARDRIQEFNNLNSKWDATPNTKATATSSGRREVTTIDREANGRREVARLTADYDHAGQALNATLSRTNDAVQAVEKTTRGYGRTLLNGIGSFGAFMVASSAVYGALSLVGRGFESFTTIERQSAVLRTVFRGTAEESDYLRDITLRLAAAYGRSAAEGMDAAVRWSRIGLTVQQTAEAVAVSLQAANVAEITAAEAAEQLSAIYAAYGLRVADLRVVLNELNTISNTVNVTNKDLLQGMSRVAALARQAGLSLAETVGIIGAAVARTGRSGAEIGNALKAMIAAISNPKLQDFMSEGFGIRVKNDGGDLKAMTTILNELFISYQKLTDAERQELLVKMGGKQQASRFAAILDGYVKSQQLAIQAQLDLTSADRENKNIRATIISQLGTMGAMFDKLALDMASAGGNLSLNTTLTSFVKLLGNALSVLDKIPLASAAVVGLLVVMTGRMLMSALAMQDGAVKANFLTSSLGQLRAAYAAMGVAVDQANARLVLQDGLLGKVAGRVLGVSGAMGGMKTGRGQGLGLTPEQEMIVMQNQTGKAGGAGKMVASILGAIPMLLRFAAGWALIAGGMWAVNKVFESFESDAEKARRALAGFNQEMENLRGKNRAADLRQRLAGTLSKSIGDTALRNPNAARESIDQFSTVAFPDRPAAAAALREEMQAMLKNHQLEELAARFAQVRLTIQKEMSAGKLTELNGSRQIVATLQQQLAIEKGKMDTSTGKPRETAAKAVRELEGQITDELGKQSQAQQELADTESERRDAETDSSKAAKKKIESRISTTDKIADAMPLAEDTATGKWERETQALDINIAQTKKRLDLYTEEKTKAESASDAKKKQVKAEVEALEQIAALRRSGLDKINTPLSMPGGPISGFGEGFKPGGRRFGEEAKARGDRLKGGKDDFTNANIMAVDMGFKNSAEATAAYEIKKKELEVAEAQAGIAGQISAEQMEAERNALAELQAKKELLKIEEERARILDEISNGKRNAKELGLANQIGTSDAEKMISEFKALNPLNNNERNRTGEVLAGSTAKPFEDQAEMLERVNRMESLLLSSTERRARLQSEIANERRREAEEASKALQMGTREEQLRAAGLAKFTKEQGRGFTGSEFQFLDKSTRESVTKFNPDAAPPELQGKSRDLEQERSLLDRSLTGMREVFDATTAEIKRLLVPAQAPGNTDINRPPPPQLNATINIDLGDQFISLVDRVESVVRDDVARIEARLGAYINRTTSVDSAQSAGQLANA